MAWPEDKNKRRTPIYDEGSALRKVQDMQPNLPGMAVRSMQEGLKAATVVPRNIVNKVTSPVREQMNIQKAVINGPTKIKLENPAIKNKIPTLASYGRRESSIAKKGKVVLDSNGNPQWQGLTGGWLRDESTGETYAVGANRGAPMRKVNRNGKIDTGFQEKKPYLASLNKSPYDITNSNWSPEETKRFMQKPLHEGTRMVSGALRDRLLRTSNSAQGLRKYSPDYSPKTKQMPRFDAPGFTGEAKKARIYSQEQQWKQRQEKNDIDQTAIQNNALVEIGRQQFEQQKERNANNRFNIKLASDQNIAKEDRLAKNKPKSKIIWVPDKDPISGKSLSTGRFYNQYGTGWIDQESTDQKKDPNGEWLNTFE